MIGRSLRTWGSRVAIWATIALAVMIASPAGAIFLDPDKGVELRFRGYAQVSIATQDSQDLVTDPPKFSGQVMQNRYFMNPELEFDFTKWLGTDWFDDLSARFAVWGFYDGLYDYLPVQYAERLSESKFHVDAQGNPCATCGFQTKARSNEAAFEGRAKRRDGRWIYGRRIRLNEAYLDMAKGPAFLRLGRQAISWGEADTIGLLDANNPFDTTIVPGVFIDLDEARIPLWTARGTYKLFSNLGPFSSGFLDAYVVPGFIDVTVSPLQMQSVSPFSAPPPAQPNAIEVAQIEPEWKFGNSRWGVRLQSVIANEFTTSVWFYKTFPTEPVPLTLGVSPVTGRLVTGVQTGRLINVAGIASSFFFSPLNSVIRSEIEVFNNVPGFRTDTNLAAGLDPSTAARVCGSVAPPGQARACYDKINIVRGELGVDRNFFLPLVNPANSFIWVSAFVFTWLPDETKYKDYRASGLIKPSVLLSGQQPDPFAPGCNGGPGFCGFVNRSKFEFFIQTHLQTDYMHGKLTPGVTAVMNSRGALALFPEVTYRITDSLIFNSRYINIHTFGSEDNGFVDLGIFRDRDEIWFKMIYQLN
jgi:hypothetical protein